MKPIQKPVGKPAGKPGGLPAGKPTAKPAGFTTVIALVLLAMITTALSATAIALHAEAQRTRSLLIDAQLRQLLLAGGSDVKQRALHWPVNLQPTEWSVQLPSDPTAGKVSAHLVPEGSSTAVQLSAQIQTIRLVETIHLERNKTGWRIADAQIDSDTHPQ